MTHRIGQDRILRVAFVLTGALAAGCVTAPPLRAPQPSISLPDRFAGAESDVMAAPVSADVAWWTTFGDDELTRLVDEAVAGNRDLRAAAARVEQAAALARAAGAALSPQLAASFDASRTRRNFIGFPIPGAGDSVLSTTTGTLGLALTVSWDADLWGRLRSAEVAAIASQMGQAALFDAARQSLAARTVKAWLQVVEARQQLDLARRALQSRDESAARVQLRYEQGLRPPGDLRLARNVAATAEAAVMARERVLDAAVRQLEVLLGRYPSGQATGSLVLPAMPPPVPAGLPADAIARRPDLVASEMALVAAGARVAESRAALLPQIRLTASGGTSSGELLDLLRGDFIVWSLVSGLTQPLFNGGRLRAGVDAAEAAREAAVAGYAQTALQAFAEVETALAADGFLLAQEEALARARDDASAARRLAEDRYFAGLAGYLDVLEAQRQELAAESQWLEVRRLRLSTRVDLHLALGGGFPAPPASPTAPSSSKEF